jgi:hypothetical protein
VLGADTGLLRKRSPETNQIDDATPTNDGLRLSEGFRTHIRMTVAFWMVPSPIGDGKGKNVNIRPFL